MLLSFKKIIYSIFILCALTISGLQAQPNLNKVKENVHQRIADSDILGASIAYIYPDGHTQFISEGYLSKDKKKRVTKNTIFEIGSITKTFTALILARLVEQKKVALDDPIDKFLPDSVHAPSYQGQKISLQDLATHTSGLPRLPSNFSPKNRLNPYADYSIHDLYEFLDTYGLKQTPGSVYEYSNLGMGLLGHLLEIASHQSYAQLLQKYITNPLEMNDTEIQVTGNKKNRLAAPYNYGDPVEHWDFPTLTGAGAIRSTTNDLIKYMKGQMGIQGSDMEAAMEMTHKIHFNAGEGNIDGIGLAWIRAAKRDTLFWHNGQTGGFHSFIGWNREKHVGVVVLANGTDNTDDIGFHLLDPDYPLKKIKRSISLSPQQLSGLVGRYKVNSRISYFIIRKGDKLYFQVTGQPKIRFYPESPTHFFCKKVPAEIEFSKGLNGEIKKVTLLQNGRKFEGTKVSSKVTK